MGMTAHTPAQPAPAPHAIAKTIEALTVSRECGVIVESHTVTVVIGQDEQGKRWATLNGQPCDFAAAIATLEAAQAVTVLAEQRPQPLAADALGTQGAWELQTLLAAHGISRAQAAAFAASALARPVATIAAGTLTTLEAERVAQAARVAYGPQATARANTLAGFSNGC